MIPELFADGIGNISVNNGVVRIELVVMDPTAATNNQNPRLEPRQRLIMPIDGFVRSFNIAENVMKKLVEAGVVNMQPPAAAPAPSTLPKPSEPAVSPNFKP
ncbi:MAG: hypothetical protein HQL60_05070 [Magnetococcales bacterium]|nr:hypothetical protein [Magnetococcales bacterium]